AARGHLSSRAPSVCELNPHLPLGLDAVISTGMAKDPAGRHGSAGELAADFQHAARPLTGVVLGPGLMIGTHLHPLLEEVILVGRGNTTEDAVHIDLTRYDPRLTVSRRHARLTVLGRSVTVEDLSSTNGTFVNELRLGPGVPLELRDGDSLRFGEVRARNLAASAWPPGVVPSVHGRP